MGNSAEDGAKMAWLLIAKGAAPGTGDLYEKGRYDQALAIWRAEAEQGDSSAQNNMGVLYARGQGVERDTVAAVTWFRRAADLGSAIARLNLGLMIAHGEGVARDKKAAAGWVRKAAEQGLPRAQRLIGMLHLTGDGVPENSAEGIEWLIKAANQEDATAQFTLGMIYEVGNGCDISLTDAFKWYRRATISGHPGAEEKLMALHARDPTLEIRVSDLLDGQNSPPPLPAGSMAMQPLLKSDADRLQFEAAVVRTAGNIFVSCSNREERFDGSARLCRYRQGHSPAWTYLDLTTMIADAALFSSAVDTETSAFLSKEGDVIYLSVDGQMTTERIVGSGLWSDDSKGWGYMIAIASIDGRLHACGSGGQVYRRSDSGHWQHIDAGLLQGKDEKGISLEAIAGPYDHEVYVGGWHKNVNDGVLFCWDGHRWASVVSDIASISSIHVEYPGSVWACGRHGTLLHGNHIDGFTKVLAPDRTRAYVAVTVYDGRVFLATEKGLYAYDGGSVERIRTGLVPEHNDGHILQVADGLLWSIGYDDIVCFDGTNWKRIPFPGNSPVR